MQLNDKHELLIEHDLFEQYIQFTDEEIQNSKTLKKEVKDNARTRTHLVSEANTESILDKLKYRKEKFGVICMPHALIMAEEDVTNWGN